MFWVFFSEWLIKNLLLFCLFCNVYIGWPQWGPISLLFRYSKMLNLTFFQKFHFLFLAMVRYNFNLIVKYKKIRTSTIRCERSEQNSALLKILKILPKNRNIFPVIMITTHLDFNFDWKTTLQFLKPKIH